MGSDDTELTWFLAQTKPNCVQIAERNLKRQGIETFLPLLEETRQLKGKFVTATRPLFPGYIFIAFDVSLGLWQSVNSTYGVTRIVSFGKHPARVPSELVSHLMLRCDTSGKLLPPRLPKAGDRVRLTKGPFATFTAQIEKTAPDRRVWVLMDFMGGKTRVAVDPNQLQSIL